MSAEPTADSPPRGTQPDTAAAPPTIALLGRPNVGKSTLFNRLTRSRQALVASVPGTTRDWREGLVRRDGLRFRLLDTGGMGFGAQAAFSAEVEQQIEAAVHSADYLWVLVDAKDGLNPFDRELCQWVRRAHKPWRVVVNKVDSPGRGAGVAEFYGLGSGQVSSVSAAHGLGIATLLEETAAALPALRAPHEADAGRDDAPAPDAAATGSASDPSGEERPLRVALLGRPNVGKSSLINRLLGRSRMIVSDVPGTTREAVETPFTLGGRHYVLVDTAGLRRKARTIGHLDKIGALHSLGALAWVDVAVLVLDAAEPPATQDARIARTIVEQRKAVVIALNKWDQVDGKRRQAQAQETAARERLSFLDFATVVRVSARTGAGLPALFKAVEQAAAQYRREIRTADLNRVVEATAARYPPAARGQSPTRIYYGSQVGTQPPAFRLFTNHPDRIDEAYTRFFERQLRHHFGFGGTPLRIEWRGRPREREPRPAAAAQRQRRPSRDQRPGRGARAKRSARASRGGRS